MKHTLRILRVTLFGVCVFGVVTFAASVIAQEQTYIKVTLCEVGSSPGKYDNHLISVKAQYDSDGMEWEGLSDANCSNRGMALQILGKAVGKNALERALHGGYPGTVDKVVTGTFSGIFHWNPENHRPRMLEVQRIEDIVAKHTGSPQTTGTQPSTQSPPGGTSLHESGHVDPPKPQ